uniref:Ovule protein n=1 Tax=Heterorhabditis bacteriophora TaxID=37862 RepID=A0A1I7WM20_HETBA
MHLVSHQRLIDLTYISGVYKYQFTLIKTPNPSKRAFYHTDSQHMFVLYSSFVRKINNQLEKISKCESDWTTMIGAMEERENCRTNSGY